ncbi:hypothetical protein TcBrA4_0020520 [Trypanosoma cruzi]|nr:hypothetical protein TcBrA4_0020520 [Trypanosoma cruzi]
MALPKNCVRRVAWWFGGRRHARPDAIPRERDGRLFPRRLGAILGDHVFAPRCLCLPHFLLDAHCATEEEERRFCAFDVATRPSRIWNAGVSGVVVDLRGAHNYWRQAEDQAQLPFECWLRGCALEAERDPTDCFMNFGSILVQAFRVRLMTASGPGIPLSNIRARHRTAVHEADVFARATQIPLERQGAQISLRC